MSKTKSNRPKLSDVAKPEVASYRHRRRAAEKGIEEAIQEGVSKAFDQALRVYAGLHPNGSSAAFCSQFKRRLIAHVESIGKQHRPLEERGLITPRARRRTSNGSILGTVQA